MHIYVLSDYYILSVIVLFIKCYCRLISLKIMLEFSLQKFYDHYNMMSNIVNFYPVVVMMLCFKLVLHNLLEQVVVMLHFRLLLHDLIV